MCAATVGPAVPTDGVLRTGRYEKDPALIAEQAIKKAKDDGMDVVLIDTAGRMQVMTRVLVAVGPLGTDYAQQQQHW